MYYLVANDKELTITLYFMDDHSLSDIYFFVSYSRYEKYLKFFLNHIFV